MIDGFFLYNNLHLKEIGGKMIKKMWIYFFIICANSLFSVPTELGNVKDFLYGNSADFGYDNWISHVAEGIASEGYNVYAPWDKQTNGFGGFVIPTEQQLEQWNEIASAFIDGNYEQAQLLIDAFEFPFEVVNMLDLSTGNEYFALREIPNMGYYDDNGTVTLSDDEFGAFEYGWGLFLFNPHATQPVIVTAPHPNDDYITTPMAYEAFLRWDARYLMINGAGREVAWTEEGNYTNGKSLSDPSRNSNHPFQKMYEMSCDKIRSDFGRREFSAQIHSADWNSHLGYADVQISAGYNKICPNLPIRDLSDLKIDVINFSEPIIHPENSVGIHNDVHLNDYYAVNYGIYDFVYENDEVSIPVNNHLSLTGYSQNRQMLYTQSGMNHYDVYEPFFHVEMHELPGCYETTEDNWYWFNGYQTETETFDFNNLFTNTFAFYLYWIDKMTEVLPFVFALDDNLVPLIPESLSANQYNFTSIQLHWQPISSFDFRTYQIRYANEPLENGNYQIINRQNNSLLASPLHTNHIIQNLQPNQTYYFQIEAIDYHDNSSGFTEEISYLMAPAHISNERAFGDDDFALLRWKANQQVNNLGFIIYRKEISSEYELLASWQTEPALTGINAPNVLYEFIDETAQNDTHYAYQIASENSDNFIHILSQELFAKPEEIHSLFVATSSEVDTTFFGKNLYATDGINEYYDIVNDDTTQTVFSAIFKDSGELDDIYLSREIIGDFLPDEEMRAFSFHLSSLTAEPIIISMDLESMNDEIYLYDIQTEQYFNLREEVYTFVPTPEEMYEFILYWGNLQPCAQIAERPNRIFQSGDTIEVNWTTNHAFLIDHMELYAFHESDTLIIDTFIPSDALHYEYSIFTEQPFHHLKYLLKVISTDNFTHQFTSHFEFGIVPTASTISLDTGSHLLANPYPENSYSAQEMFGVDNSLFLLNSAEQFLTAETFDFGTGYWLTANQPLELNVNGEIMGETQILPLHQGWNLVPNPHLFTYSRKTLKFVIAEVGTLSFGQSVDLGYISPTLFTYSDGKYAPIEDISPMESFFLYAYMPIPVSVNFHPYQAISPVAETNLDWQISFQFSQTEYDSDAFAIGAAAHSSDEFDILFDVPNPPFKPFEHAISVYIDKDGDTSYPYPRLFQEAKKYIEAEEEFTKQWDFELVISDLEPVIINAEFENVPDTYEVTLHLNDFEQIMEPDVPIEYLPTTIGELQGFVSVENLPTNQSTTVFDIQEVINYPNPFNPSTTIRFAIKAESKIELIVYNIKGQKVRTLCSDYLTAGKHEILWNGKDEKNKNVSSGVYFYKLSVNSKTETFGKCLLMK
jgi:hypothetical protein